MDLARLIDAVAREYDLNPSEITTRTRRQPVAAARQLVIYLLRTTTRLTLTEIGAAVGRHHATVIHAVNTIDGRRAYDHTLNNQIRRLTIDLTMAPSNSPRATGSPATGTPGHSTNRNRESTPV